MNFGETVITGLQAGVSTIPGLVLAGILTLAIGVLSIHIWNWLNYRLSYVEGK